jgi:hypothetical protein
MRARRPSQNHAGWNRRRPACWAALFALAGAGCTSRTLPLPPPEVQALSAPDADGIVRVRGLAQAGASIGVINEVTQTGTVVTTIGDDCDRNCPFEAEIEAVAGDALRVWQFFETERSVEAVVPAR